MNRTLTPRKPRLGDLTRQAADLAKQRRIGPTYLKVFLLIAGYADAGIDDPSWGELAAGAKVGTNTVRNAIRKLQRAGLVKVEHRGGEEDRDRYELLIPRNGGRPAS